MVFRRIYLGAVTILAFMFPVLYSPNEPVHFLGFFTSWIRIRMFHVDPDPGGISLCGSGSETLDPGANLVRRF